MATIERRMLGLWSGDFINLVVINAFEIPGNLYKKRLKDSDGILRVWVIISFDGISGKL